MNFEGLSPLLPVGLLVIGSALLQSITSRTADPAPAGAGLAPIAGQGMVLAVLGGFRAPAADVLWLRANAAWERRDLVATDALLRAAIAADPRSEYFRINGARMIAFDLPEWRVPADAPAAVAASIRREHAESALALLAEGARLSGPTFAQSIEMARICYQRLADNRRAAESYRRAAEMPGAPYFAGRLHVEMLVADGRIGEASEWLRNWLPGLPSDHDAAERPRMEARLEELDRMLARTQGAGSGGPD